MAQFHYQFYLKLLNQRISQKFQISKINLLQLSLLFSIPASLGLIIASEEIINGLFGYGSFTAKDVEMTSKALMFFGYGVIAFALVKILSNFFSLEIIQKLHFIFLHL